jgi:hypothetical protein
MRARRKRMAGAVGVVGVLAGGALAGSAAAAAGNLHLTAVGSARPATAESPA